MLRQVGSWTATLAIVQMMQPVASAARPSSSFEASKEAAADPQQLGDDKLTCPQILAETQSRNREFEELLGEADRLKVPMSERTMALLAAHEAIATAATLAPPGSELVMPALINRQFYLFRDGDKPIGLALWAKCGPEAVAKLDRGLLEEGNQLTLEEWQSGDDVWLVDLIAPFATAENRQRELMFADLISGPLAGVPFSFHQTDPKTGKRTVQKVGAEAGAKLKEALETALGKA